MTNPPELRPAAPAPGPLRSPAARRWLVGGRVQGVGYRPFVYRLAHRLGVAGWVRNLTGRVEIVAQAPAHVLASFAKALCDEAPPLAGPVVLEGGPVTARPATGFSIRDSLASGPAAVHVPPDYFTCDQCLGEMLAPGNRRYRYPFINCTQCGPRYTLIDRLPYDRPHTAMAGFPLCPECAREYHDPLDRRFHAQPLACPACGPQALFSDAAGRSLTGEAALQGCLEALRAGRIVALKGTGGYHLICDGTDEAAVARLRRRKRRPHQPLALMVPWTGPDGLAWARRIATLGPEEAGLLRGPMRPIVLCPARPAAPAAPGVAPGLAEVGLMLPYSPLHHLLLHELDAPVVATSGNISGEPVLTDNAEAAVRLAGVADAFLHHDRPVRRPADDPVYRVIAGRPRPLRLGRGVAPLELELPAPVSRPTLAVGAQMKSTVALAWDDRVVISPHIGDLGSVRAETVFEQVIADLQRLYGVKAAHLVCDAHTGYRSARWARSRGLPLTRVGHHAAHASALAGEHRPPGQALMFTWDGTGLGDDGTLWGGEALLGRPGQWRRVGSWRPFRLPGAERAIRQPWRTALALCWEAGLDAFDGHCPDERLRHLWRRGVNCPVTTAVGRLFDGAAALCGLVHESTHEGQGPMRLEAVCGPHGGAAPAPPLYRDESGVWRSDWAPLLAPLMDRAVPLARRAADFHAGLAAALVQQALAVRREQPLSHVGLTGGVFQNRVLTGLAAAQLERHGFQVMLPREVPGNDAGISYGQVLEAAARTCDERP